ncbi:MAG: DEAD/DEAH box helicase [Microthrixaceae bacterium]
MTSTSIRLRPWQKTALERFEERAGPDFLAVATPGAGKTTFALTAAARELASGRCARLVVVAPTQHLKHQWTDAACRFGVHLDPDWSARDGALPADMHGIVTTYQQVATSAEALSRLSSGSFVVLDEVHHAGDDRTWGSSVLVAFASARRRLSLSGTPFRSDSSAIPFVDYHLDTARADFEYGYGDALRDGRVVRPVFFPALGGDMEWIAPDGSEQAAGFDDALDTVRANQRLRTALSADGAWLPRILTDAHARLLAIRRRHADAGGLVIATDQDHARSIATIMRRRLGVVPVVATSDDPTASGRIAAFAAGSAPWIVAVRMVSEGVDIPRLRVGVFATTTTTELFFRQAVGRLVRWTPGVRSQRAYLFIPDDARLRRWAGGIAEQRRHQRRRPDGDDGDVVGTQGDTGPPDAEEAAREQLSLFSAISAVATEEATVVALYDDWDDLDEEDEPAGLEVHVVVPPPPGLASSGDAVATTRRQHKRQLRQQNAEAVADLVRFTARDHRSVNAELNRRVGLVRISEATVEQLERRLEAANRWIRDC